MEKNGQENSAKIHDVTLVSGLYENWFLDNASYISRADSQRRSETHTTWTTDVFTRSRSSLLFC
jgi:hypothetical protein